MKTHLVLLCAIPLVSSAACDVHDITIPVPRQLKCNLKYVPDGLRLHIEPDSPNGFPGGTLRLEIKADGALLDITAEHADGTMHCLELGCEVSVDIDSRRTLLADAHLHPDGGHVLIKRLFDGEEDGGPAAVSVTLAIDGQRIAAGHFEPEYTDSEPYGAGCGVVTTASETLIAKTIGL